MALIHKKIFRSNNKKAVFLLEGWKTKLSHYWLFAKILQLYGYGCILYSYNSSIYSPDLRKTRESFIEVKKDILNEIYHLKEIGYVEFSVFGTSLGSSLALMAANESNDITNIILNTTGASLTQAAWENNEVFKRQWNKDGIFYKDVYKSWKVLNAENNINKLKGKRILIYLGKKDTVIPYQYGKELTHKLKEKEYAFKLYINNTNDHLMTAFLNLLFFWRYIKFLQE